MENKNVTLKFEERGLYPGRMICGSKSFYCEGNPDNIPIFNANIIDAKTNKKVWHGDLDITLDAETLRELAKELDTEYLILYESDGRFDNEDSPKVNKYIWSTESGINKNYKKCFTDEMLAKLK